MNNSIKLRSKALAKNASQANACPNCWGVQSYDTMELRGDQLWSGKKDRKHPDLGWVLHYVNTHLAKAKRFCSSAMHRPKKWTS